MKKIFLSVLIVLIFMNTEAQNKYLRLISEGQTVSISACRGGKKAGIYYAKKTFLGWIDPDFKDYGINLPQPATEKIDVNIYEIHNEKVNFKTLFGSLSSNLKSLTFKSQKQIKKFVQKNKKWLCTGSYGTFFLFTEKINGEEKFFVAGVRVYPDGDIDIYVSHLSNAYVWCAGFGHRLVIPAIKNLEY